MSRSERSAYVEQCLRVFHPQPGSCVELRALGVRGKRAVCEAFADLAALAQRAVELDEEGATGCYFTLNPLRPDLAGSSASCRAADVVERHWLPLDVDPHRPSGTPASEGELIAAWDVAQSVGGLLEAAGLVAPVVGFSGNGWHRCYPILLPNDDDAQALMRAVLRGLHERCGHALASDEAAALKRGEFLSVPSAKVETDIHDAPRIWKLYGTKSRKGRERPEGVDQATGEVLPARLHRWARLVSDPSLPWEEGAARANVEALRRLVAGWQHADDLRRGRPQTAGTAYGAAALQRELAAVASAAVGDRNNQLNRSAFAVGQLVAGGALSGPEAEAALLAAGGAAGLSEAEVRATVRSGLAAGSKEPRSAPEGSGLAAPRPTAPPSASMPSMLPSGSLIVRASEIEPRLVEWLWPGRIPLGKLVTYAGMGGLGKTMALCDLAARVSAGLAWPDCPDGIREPGQALLVSGEDDPEDTLVPRLIEAGADRSRVAFLRTEVLDRFTLADLPGLDRIADEIGPGLRLVAIDPPTAFLGGVDDHKNSELRALLSPLKSWAARRNCSIVFNTHLNKGGGSGKVEALLRVMGSVAWVNAVRAAYLFVRDPEDPERRFWVPMKMNLGRDKKGLAYQIASPSEGRARLEWLGEIDVTADDAVAGQGGREQRRTPRAKVAAAWLVERFRERREWPSKELFRAAVEEGFSRDAIFAARRVFDSPPKAKKLNQIQGPPVWVWSVPEDWPPLTEEMI